MGQLERYGLYVLAVVVMLIVGVAVFGGEPASNGVVASEIERPWDETADRDQIGWRGGSAYGSSDDLQRMPPAGSDDSSLDLFLRRGTETEPDRSLDSIDRNRGNLGRDESPEFVDQPSERQGAVAPDPNGSGPNGSGPNGAGPNGAGPNGLGPAELGVDSRESASRTTHQIARGDTFEGIARRYYGSVNVKVATDALVAANSQIAPSRMIPGREVVLPEIDGVAPRGGRSSSRAVAGQSNDRGASGSSASGSTYRVRPGDTLTGIAAAQYHVSGRDLQKVLLVLKSSNRLADPNKLDRGQELRLPDIPGFPR